MRVRACLPMGLMLLMVASTGCERSETRRARQVMDLVRTMETELQTTAKQAAGAFSRRADFEDLRMAFGDERFDAGTPLGPDFQGNLAAMIQGLHAQFEKEPKDAGFPKKVARRINQFGQWWSFVRHYLETRRDQLNRAAANGSEPVSLPGGRTLRGEVLTTLAEVIKVVEAFETITNRCARGIEGIVARS